mmetsp:Transcript_49674/g.115174  ORF Transcript_49674/g.115174 Transcript_49674/m.115174 type:complete len:201 (+) Transcript_49674:1546-2148(+)
MIDATSSTPAGASSWCNTLPLSGSSHKSLGEECLAPPPGSPGAAPRTSSSLYAAELDGKSCIQGLHPPANEPREAASSPQARPASPRYLCHTISDVVASSANSFDALDTARINLSAPKSRSSSAHVGTLACSVVPVRGPLRERFGESSLQRKDSNSMGSCTNCPSLAGISVNCAPSAGSPWEALDLVAARCALITAADRL